MIVHTICSVIMWDLKTVTLVTKYCLVSVSYLMIVHTAFAWYAIKKKRIVVGDVFSETLKAASLAHISPQSHHHIFVGRGSSILARASSLAFLASLYFFGSIFLY